MKSLALNVLLFTVLALGLSACSSSPSSQIGSPSPSKIEPPEKIEIVWYVKTSPVENPWEKDVVVPDFEAKHPNIKINLVIAANADFDTKMLAMYAAGTPPDVFSHWGQTGWADFYRRGMIADLTPFIQRDNFDLSDFIPEVLDVFRIDGRIMGLPMFRTGSFVFYNKDLFDAAGVLYPPTNWDDTSWTWDSFVEKCGRLTKKTGNAKDTLYGCNLSLWPLDGYPRLFGQELFPDSIYETGFADKAYLDSQSSIAAFQSIQDLVWKLHYMPDPATADSLGGSNLFQSGKVAMQLDGGWGWWDNKGLESKFRWGVAALPYGAPGRKAIVFADPWLMSSKTKHPEESWQFISYLASLDVQKQWMESGGAPPARLSLLDTWYHEFPTMSPEEVKEVHLGAIKYGRACPCDFTVRYDQIDQFLYSAVDRIFNNQSTAAEVLPEANRQLEELLSKIMKEYKK